MRHLAIILSSSAAFCWTACAAPLEIEALLTTGDAVGDENYTFHGFGQVHLNSAGEILFSSRTSHTGTGYGGIFFADGRVVALDGQEYGDDGLTLGSSVGSGGAFLLTESGDAIFSSFACYVCTPSTYELGIFKGSNTTITLTGSTVDANGETLFEASRFTASDRGEVAYVSRTYPSYDYGIHREDGSAVAFTGTPSPLPGTEFYGSFKNPVINSVGQIAFTASVIDASQTVKTGLFFDGKVVALEGEEAGNSGHTFSRASFSAENIFLNDDGELTFAAAIDTDDGRVTGLFREDGSAIVSGNIPVKGAPGAFTGVGNVVMNGSGEFAFENFASGFGPTPRKGIFLDDGTVIALRGTVAGNTGTYFSSFYSDITINDRGYVAFNAITSKAGVRYDGLFLYDRENGLRTVAFEGDEIIDSHGIVRTIMSISFVPGGLSENGIAFSAGWRTGGGSGLFFVPFDELEEVPLPAAAPLMLAGLGFLGWTRRSSSRLAYPSHGSALPKIRERNRLLL
ncbi:MAG: VPLPA-CTERM sorting domain-containing protein [Pseudomonadota bacterium]